MNTCIGGLKFNKVDKDSLVVQTKRKRTGNHDSSELLMSKDELQKKHKVFLAETTLSNSTTPKSANQGNMKLVLFYFILNFENINIC